MELVDLGVDGIEIGRVAGDGGAEHLEGGDHGHVVVDEGLKDLGGDALGVVGGVGEDVDAGVAGDEDAGEVGGMGKGELAVGVGDLDGGGGVGDGHGFYVVALDVGAGEEFEDVGSASDVGFLVGGGFRRGVAGWGMNFWSGLGRVLRR